jgi:hypothetical protein
MTSFRRLALGLVGLSFAFAGGATAWLSGAEPAVASIKQAATVTQPHCVNFTIHSSVDTNYCVEDIPAPAVPASEASMSQCADRDGQRWTFADPTDGSLVIIGGNTGNCLDFSAAAPALVSMTPCTFSSAEHFLYTAKGQIKSISGKKCLEAAQATQDASISIVKCKNGVPLQIWQLGH